MGADHATTSRAEQSRGEQNRTEQTRTEQTRPEQNWLEFSDRVGRMRSSGPGSFALVPTSYVASTLL